MTPEGKAAGKILWDSIRLLPQSLQPINKCYLSSFFCKRVSGI